MRTDLPLMGLDHASCYSGTLKKETLGLLPEQDRNSDLNRNRYNGATTEGAGPSQRPLGTWHKSETSKGAAGLSQRPLLGRPKETTSAVGALSKKPLWEQAQMNPGIAEQPAGALVIL